MSPFLHFFGLTNLLEFDNVVFSFFERFSLLFCAIVGCSCDNSTMVVPYRGEGEKDAGLSSFNIGKRIFLNA